MTTYTIGNLVYTVVDNGAGLLGDESYTVSIATTGGTSILPSTSIDTGVLGTGLLGTGGVVTGSTGYTELLALASGTFISVPGSTGGITLTLALGAGNVFYIGGTTQINAGANVLGSQTIDVYGGTASFASGTVANALSGTTVNIGYGGTFSPGTGLADILGNATINFLSSGGTFVVNAGGTLLNLSTTTINGFTGVNSKIQLQNLSGSVDSYTITGTPTGTQTITLLNAGGTSIGSFSVFDSGFTNNTYTFGSDGPLAFTASSGTTSGTTTYSIDVAANSPVPCFLTGTRIATPDGFATVEALQIGDLVLTAQGDAVPVRWIGKRVVSPRFADPLRHLPVRIGAGALGAGQPTRDLLISPDHAVLVDDILVNAGALVDGESITRVSGLKENFTYYHVEVDAHELILAEGVSAETFIDHVDRMAFDNWAEHEEIFGGAPEKPEMGYARVKSARQLPIALRRRLGIAAAA